MKKRKGTQASEVRRGGIRGWTIDGCIGGCLGGVDFYLCKCVVD